MKNIIKNLPKDQGHDKSVMKVGFITYNNTVHFYNVKSSLAQPQMMVVGDVQVSPEKKKFTVRSGNTSFFFYFRKCLCHF